MLNADALRDALSSVTAESLETMFFIPVLGEAEDPDATAELAAVVSFDGDLSGTFKLALSSEAARSLSSAFLATEEESVAPVQKESVLVELTNVIGGATLSTVSPSGSFDLGVPSVVPASADLLASCTALQLDSGVLWIGAA